MLLWMYALYQSKFIISIYNSSSEAGRFNWWFSRSWVLGHHRNIYLAWRLPCKLPPSGSHFSLQRMAVHEYSEAFVWLARLELASHSTCWRASLKQWHLWLDHADQIWTLWVEPWANCTLSVASLIIHTPSFHARKGGYANLWRLNFAIHALYFYVVK